MFKSLSLEPQKKPYQVQFDLGATLAYGLGLKLKKDQLARAMKQHRIFRYSKLGYPMKIRGLN